MISLIIPPKDQISRVSKMLADEFGTASNIKSRVNRLSVLGAITSVQHRLKLYTKGKLAPHSYRSSSHCDKAYYCMYVSIYLFFLTNYVLFACQKHIFSIKFLNIYVIDLIILFCTSKTLLFQKLLDICVINLSILFYAS